jgi:hypothetical protein
MNVPLERMAEILEHLGKLGLTCIVKVVGERLLAGGPPRTIVISGGPLAEWPIRREGRELQSCFGEALAEAERLLAGAGIPTLS